MVERVEKLMTSMAALAGDPIANFDLGDAWSFVDDRPGTTIAHSMGERRGTTRLGAVKPHVELGTDADRGARIFDQNLALARRWDFDINYLDARFVGAMETLAPHQISPSIR